MKKFNVIKSALFYKALIKNSCERVELYADMYTYQWSYRITAKQSSEIMRV